MASAVSKEDAEMDAAVGNGSDASGVAADGSGGGSRCGSDGGSGGRAVGSSGESGNGIGSPRLARVRDADECFDVAASTARQQLDEAETALQALLEMRAEPSSTADPRAEDVFLTNH